MLRDYYASTESKFTSIAKLCEALNLSLISNNLSGFNLDILTSVKQREIHNECKQILKKNYYHGLLRNDNQVQLVVRSFIEDLVNNLEHEIQPSDSYKSSYTYETLSNYKSEQSAKAEKNNSETIADIGDLTDNSSKDSAQNRSNILESEVAYYNKIHFSSLKKYTLLVEEPLFQAALMNYLNQALGSKKYVPVYGGSLIIELRYEKIKIVTVYYNNHSLLQESMVVFVEKLKDRLLTEKDINIYCGFDWDMDRIYTIIFYSLVGIILFLALVMVYYFFFTGLIAQSSQDSKSREGLASHEEGQNEFNNDTNSLLSSLLNKSRGSNNENRETRQNAHKGKDGKYKYGLLTKSKNELNSPESSKDKQKKDGDERQDKYLQQKDKIEEENSKNENMKSQGFVSKLDRKEEAQQKSDSKNSKMSLDKRKESERKISNREKETKSLENYGEEKPEDQGIRDDSEKEEINIS